MRIIGTMNRAFVKTALCMAGLGLSILVLAVLLNIVLVLTGLAMAP
mgnify:CR=1 FL=1